MGLPTGTHWEVWFPKQERDIFPLGLSGRLAGSKRGSKDSKRTRAASNVLGLRLLGLDSEDQRQT